MKPIKLLIGFFVLACSVLFYSCDNRTDYFSEINKAPTLTIIKSGIELSSSALSDSLKIGQPVSLNYNIVDEEKIKIQVTQDGHQITADQGSGSITFTGIAEGQDHFTLKAKDSFGEEVSFSITFTVFRNIAPIARFSFKKIGVSSPWEYEIDASASYDKDARFNGKITEYEYTLGTYKFNSPLSKIRYVFGSAGQKLIRVRVKDNNDTWSGLESDYIVLN